MLAQTLRRLGLQAPRLQYQGRRGFAGDYAKPKVDTSLDHVFGDNSNKLAYNVRRGAAVLLHGAGPGSRSYGLCACVRTGRAFGALYQTRPRSTPVYVTVRADADGLAVRALAGHSGRLHVPRVDLSVR